MQRRPGAGLQQQLRAVASGPSFHRRRHRPEQFDPMQTLLGEQSFGRSAGFVEKTFGLTRLVRFGTQQRQVGERRQSGGTALAQRLLGEGKGLQRLGIAFSDDPAPAAGGQVASYVVKTKATRDAGLFVLAFAGAQAQAEMNPQIEAGIARFKAALRLKPEQVQKLLGLVRLL